MLDDYGVEGVIGLKMQGSINKVPWRAACKKKFKNHPDGWDLVMAQVISEWEARIADQEYHPFWNRNLGGDTWEVSPSVLFRTFESGGSVCFLCLIAIHVGLQMLNKKTSCLSCISYIKFRSEKLFGS